MTNRIDTILPNGPFAREMSKPQIMHVKYVSNYELDKLRKRHEYNRYLHSRNNTSRGK